MSYLETSNFKRTGAATNRRRANRNPMQLIAKLRDDDKTSSWERLFPKWKRAVEADDDYLGAVIEYAWANWTTQYDRDNAKRRQKVVDFKVVQERRIEAARIVKEAPTLILMNLLLPNGKKLKDATFAECSRAGGWFKMLATKGKPSEIVGEKLTEDDLRKLK